MSTIPNKINLETITTIFFDLDNTLLDHSFAEEHANRELYQTYQDIWGDIPFETVVTTYRKHSKSLWEELTKGNVTREHVRYQRFVNTLTEFNLPTTNAVQMGDIYLKIYRNYWKLYDGALEVLRHLKKQFCLGMITNGFSDVQHKKLDRFQLYDYFDVIVICDEIGFLKPNPKIFEFAERESGAKTNEIIFVGDSYTADILGGHAAGWKTIWIRPPEKAVSESVADWEITHINELNEMLNI